MPWNKHATAGEKAGMQSNKTDSGPVGYDRRRRAWKVPEDARSLDRCSAIDDRTESPCLAPAVVSRPATLSDFDPDGVTGETNVGALLFSVRVCFCKKHIREIVSLENG